MVKMKKNGPIALFDSGVGGLTIAKEIIAEFPEEDVIYFGDTAHLPYGIREQTEVKDFVVEIIDYFVNLGAKIVIIACNTATAAGLEIAREKFNIPIIGPIEAGVKEAIIATKNNRVGVIATEGTIASRAYQNKIDQLSTKIEVFSEACPSFIPLVESGELYSLKVLKIAESYLNPLKEKNIDTLLLGCTHFPYLTKVIREVIGDDVNLIYPGRGIALQVRNILEEARSLKSHQNIGKTKFYVSDLNKLSDKFVGLGKEFLGFSDLSFEELDLWDNKIE